MRIKTVTTKSGINQVEFRDTDDRYYWIKNKGDNSILVSTEHPDTLADGEGITEIEPGQITLVENYGNVLYINGESEVEIREQDIPVCPFEGAGAALATSEDIEEYSDYQLLNIISHRPGTTGLSVGYAPPSDWVTTISSWDIVVTNKANKLLYSGVLSNGVNGELSISWDNGAPTDIKLLGSAVSQITAWGVLFQIGNTLSLTPVSKYDLATSSPLGSTEVLTPEDVVNLMKVIGTYNVYMKRLS